MITLRNIMALASAGMILALYASALTSISLLPEYARLLWAICVPLAAISLASLRPFTPATLLIAALLSTSTLWLIAWSNGALYLSYLMTKFLVTDASIIPTSAFTPRDVTFRYGLFFATVLLGTLPFLVALTLVIKGLAFKVGKLLSLERRLPKSAARLINSGFVICAAASAISVIAFYTLGLNDLQLEHLRISG